MKCIFDFFLIGRIFTCRELARKLGEKGAIDFSDVEHVILKSIALLFLILSNWFHNTVFYVVFLNYDVLERMCYLSILFIAQLSQIEFGTFYERTALLICVVPRPHL